MTLFRLLFTDPIEGEDVVVGVVVHGLDDRMTIDYKKHLLP